MPSLDTFQHSSCPKTIKVASPLHLYQLQIGCRSARPHLPLPYPLLSVSACSRRPYKIFPQHPYPQLSRWWLLLQVFYPSQTFLAPPTFQFPITSTSGGSAEDPIKLSDDNGKKWPKDYYVCEIVPCFRDAKTYVRGRHARTAAVIFHEHFPRLQFHSSTFSDNKAIWRKASRTLKNHYLVVGKKKAGLWSTFAAEAKKEATQTSLPAVCRHH